MPRRPKRRFDLTRRQRDGGIAFFKVSSRGNEHRVMTRAGKTGGLYDGYGRKLMFGRKN